MIHFGRTLLIQLAVFSKCADCLLTQSHRAASLFRPDDSARPDWSCKEPAYFVKSINGTSAWYVPNRPAGQTQPDVTMHVNADSQTQSASNPMPVPQ